MAKQEVTIEFDLDDFSDDEIAAEYEARRLGGRDSIDADFDRLAALIVAGETDDALQLLHEISDGAFCISTVKRLNAIRSASRAGGPNG